MRGTRAKQIRRSAYRRVVNHQYEDLRRPWWPKWPWVPDWRQIYRALKRKLKRVLHPPRTITFKKGGRYAVPLGDRMGFDRLAGHRKRATRMADKVAGVAVTPYCGFCAKPLTSRSPECFHAESHERITAGESA